MSFGEFWDRAIGEVEGSFKSVKMRTLFGWGSCTRHLNISLGRINERNLGECGRGGRRRSNRSDCINLRLSNEVFIYIRSGSITAERRNLNTSGIIHQIRNRVINGEELAILGGKETAGLEPMAYAGRFGCSNYSTLTQPKNRYHVFIFTTLLCQCDRVFYLSERQSNVVKLPKIASL